MDTGWGKMRVVRGEEEGGQQEGGSLRCRQIPAMLRAPRSE